MALTMERTTVTAGTPGPSRGTYKIKANTRNFKGGIVGLDVAGRACPGAAIAGGCLFCVGKASHTLNNLTGSELGGAADAADQEVEFGVFGWDNDASITVAHVGKFAYAVDDHTAGISSAGATLCFLGVITEVRDGQVFVHSSPTVAALGVATIAAFLT